MDAHMSYRHKHPLSTHSLHCMFYLPWKCVVGIGRGNPYMLPKNHRVKSTLSDLATCPATWRHRVKPRMQCWKPKALSIELPIQPHQSCKKVMFSLLKDQHLMINYGPFVTQLYFHSGKSNCSHIYADALVVAILCTVKPYLKTNLILKQPCY